MEIKQTALLAIQEAGKILMENINQIKEINLKQKNDYLTNVDIEAENKIKAIIKSKFPDHSIVTEESEIENNNSPYTWYIDPISSTMNYVHGLPHFATAIALQHINDFIFSAVLDPFFNELFYAEKGNGVYMNEEKIHVSTIDDLAKSLIFIVLNSKGIQNKEEGMKYFQTLFPSISSFRRLGSLALELCYVACSRMEGHIYTKTDIFSIPAGKLILEEAGGKVTDFEGKPWDIQSETIVATNGKIHDQLLMLIQQCK